MRNLAIITARGGSKRIPRKNVRLFLGKPIIAYSIEAAANTDLFEEIMVSTDDDEIAEIAMRYGAKVPFFRSKSTSDDYSTTTDVLLEVIKVYSAQGKFFDKCCCIYPTAPLITKDRLIESFQHLQNHNFDSVFPVSSYSYPIYRALTMNNNRIEMIWPENLSKRSQDFPSAYHDAGQFYWFDIEKFIIKKSLFTSNSSAIFLDEMEVQDIDNESDWNLAELKFTILQNKKLT